MDKFCGMSPRGSLPTLTCGSAARSPTGEAIMGENFKLHQAVASPGRRSFLRITASSLIMPLGAMAPPSWRTDPAVLDEMHPPICRVAAAITPAALPRELKITWNMNAVCNVGVAVADARGFFAKRNLKVEKVNFAGATDQLLELLASGKADGGCGMGVAWMKPLEQGFDVKLTAAIHGGCIRLITTPGSGIDSVAGLK